MKKRARLTLEEEVRSLRQGDALRPAEKINEEIKTRQNLEDEVRELNRKNKVLMSQMEDLLESLKVKGRGM